MCTSVLVCFTNRVLTFPLLLINPCLYMVMAGDLLQWGPVREQDQMVCTIVCASKRQEGVTISLQSFIIHILTSRKNMSEAEVSGEGGPHPDRDHQRPVPHFEGK